MLAVYCPRVCSPLPVNINSALEKIEFQLPDAFQMEELCFRKENQAVRSGQGQPEQEHAKISIRVSLLQQEITDRDER